MLLQFWPNPLNTFWSCSFIQTKWHLIHKVWFCKRNDFVKSPVL